jgi:hypothetical protein
MALPPVDFRSFVTVDVRQFFDRTKCETAAERSLIRQLSYIGGLIRRIARNSMRRRKSASAPGSPPSAHSGEFKKLILYGLDYGGNSVVIGPTARWRTRSTSGLPRMGPLHEFGGKAEARYVFWDRKEKKKITLTGGLASRRSFKDATLPNGEIRYIPMNWIKNSEWHARGTNSYNPIFPARPFMSPALFKAVPQIKKEFPVRFGQDFGMSFSAAMSA